MSKFIALPVGQGDAFYLDRGGFHVLVDGGKSKTAISNLLDNGCETKHLDVLVCTHNDSDHANGVLGLLDNWDGTIDEVWLPGSWTHRMKDLFENPRVFVNELVENISDMDFQENKDLTLEDVVLLDSPHSNEVNSEALDLSDIIDKSNDFSDFLFEVNSAYLGLDLLYYFERHYFSDSFISIFLDAMNAANLIKTITELAFHKGAKIRFFDYGKHVSGGFSGILEPVNSTEITGIRKREVSALQYIALSTANKESLVFYSPESTESPAVLFSADSDLNFSLPVVKHTKKPIITSPHHGSDANATAYNVVLKWLGANLSPIWVRSDCKCKTRPGTAFKNQACKFCTLCNCGLYPKQTVKLHSSDGIWLRTQGTRVCSCR